MPRREVCGDEVTYIVTRNINYTNICLYHCSFCAFSKGRGSEDLRGAPYVVDLEEIAPSLPLSAPAETPKTAARPAAVSVAELMKQLNG